jgi:hypothetical protein
MICHSSTLNSGLLDSNLPNKARMSMKTKDRCEKIAMEWWGTGFVSMCQPTTPNPSLAKEGN